MNIHVCRMWLQNNMDFCKKYDSLKRDLKYVHNLQNRCSFYIKDLNSSLISLEILKKIL